MFNSNYLTVKGVSSKASQDSDEMQDKIRKQRYSAHVEDMYNRQMAYMMEALLTMSKKDECNSCYLTEADKENSIESQSQSSSNLTS